MLFQRRRRYRWSEQKRTRKVRLLPKALIVIGIVIAIELLARLIVNTASLKAQLTFDQSPAIVQAYGLNFASPSGETYKTLPAQGQLTAAPDPLMGYKLLPGQTSDFWSINEQGFRDQDPISVEKSANEVRIVTLGGSTAFGQLSSGNAATFAEQLEGRLNNQVVEQQNNPEKFQPEVLPYRADHVEEALNLPPRIRSGQYRVLNAAVPGYASGNELALLVQQVADYNPDIVIVLDSFVDLMLPSDHSGVGVPGLDAALQNLRPAPTRRIMSNIRTWFSNLSAVKLFRYYGLGVRPLDVKLTKPLNLMLDHQDADLVTSLAPDETELDLRVQRYQQHLLQMVRWISGSRKRLIIGLQPEITGRPADKLTPEEAAILSDLGAVYPEGVKAGYEKLAKAATQVANASENVKLLNLYQLYDALTEQAFQSPTSLTDKANTVLANRFYQEIATDFVVQPKPFGS